jgi:tetratricopeptide (TPR) repeat protein
VDLGHLRALKGKLRQCAITSWRARRLCVLCLSLLIFCWAWARPGTEITDHGIEVLIDRGGLAEAKELLQGRAAASRESPGVRYLRAKLLFKERKFNESLETLSSLLPLALGQQVLPSGDLQVAGPVAVLDASFRTKILSLVGQNYVQLDHLDKAEPVLLTAAQLSVGDHLVRFQLGMLYFSTSRFAAAESAFAQVVRLNPGFMKGHEFLGLSQEELDKVELAIRSYRTAIELSVRRNQGDSSPYLRLGRLLLARNRHVESLPLLEQAARLMPDSAETFFLLGKTLSTLGRPSEAEEALLRSAACDKNYADPHYLLSRLYLAQRRSADAQQRIQIFQQLKAKEPKNIAKPKPPDWEL